MRTRFALLALLIACGPSTSTPTTVAAPRPPDPTQPDPGGLLIAPDPSPITDGDVTVSWVNGMQILVKRIPHSEVTTTALFIRGGARNWGKADAGIEGLAVGVATSGGTERLDKDAFTRRLSELGSSVNAWSSPDFSVFSAWSLTPVWDETFDHMTDTFLRPALPAAQIELVRAQLLQNLKREQEDPDSRLGLLVDENIYRGHPFQHRSAGTLETVAGFTADQLRAHLAKLRETARLVLVVVGDVDPAQVALRAREALGHLPRGAHNDTAFPAWTTDKAAVTIVEDKLPTNYIMAVFPGPGWSDPEYPVAMVAMNTLGYRVWEEVRSKRNLSYAPGAWFNGGSSVTHGTLYVTATDPVATMTVILDEARRLRDERIPDKDLAGTRSMLKTSTIASKEAPADQAWQLGVSQIVGGDWHLVRTLPERLQTVTADEIHAWASKHITRLRTFVIGDKSKIDVAALEAF